MTDRHTCPRRVEQGMDREDSPFEGSGKNLDTYTRNAGLVGQARGCSYCGSMHPDEFMQAVRDYKRIGVTTKGYKFYVHETADMSSPTVGKFYTQHLSHEQGWEFDALWKEAKILFDFKPPLLFIPGPSHAMKEDGQ